MNASHRARPRAVLALAGWLLLAGCAGRAPRPETPAPAAAPVAQEASALQQAYGRYLAAEGYRWDVDSDGDVHFQREGRHYYIIIDASDAEFFRVVLPNIWPIESAAERQQVEAACDAVNRGAKVAKAYTLNDDVWLAVELFIGEENGWQPLFQRSLTSIDYALGVFVGAMRGE